MTGINRISRIVWRNSLPAHHGSPAGGWPDLIETAKMRRTRVIDLLRRALGDLFPALFGFYPNSQTGLFRL